VAGCPFCRSQDVIKKGKRQKKYEVVQLYLCRHCHRRFTPLIHKHRTYPLKIIQEALTLYNRFYSLEETAKLIYGSYGVQVSFQTINNWLKDFRDYLPILKLRSKIINLYDKRRIFIESRLLHGQVYDFKCHFAKLDFILKKYPEYRNFNNLGQFLDHVPAACPHELFRKNAKKQSRSSRNKNLFNIDQVKIFSKFDNLAIRNARFALQAVAKNKLRHEILQEFMLINDSVTVAVEVPVFLEPQDILYYQRLPGFNIPISLADGETITGHIDFLQVRNGMIHILDYKPGAKKEKPIEQLTLYALALSRLTDLRLYHFKCAWFDDKNYYEFYPLHVVYKKRKIVTKPFSK